MSGILFLGLLLGLQHALEADHLATVASLSSRSVGLRDAARHGAAWGIGHGLTLLAFGGALLYLGQTLPGWFANALEFAVGVMLMLLGGDVLRRLWRQGIHFHVHSHGEQRHFHAHTHSRGSDHAADPHHHPHQTGLPRRTMLVGMLHGLAGSAALLVFALGSFQSATLGLAYILVFATGSILGMTLLSVVISLPLRWSAQRLTWAYNGLTLVLGLVSVTLGIVVAEQSAVALLGLIHPA